MKISKVFLQFSWLLVSLARLASGSPIYYLATGQTGGQTQIDVNHTSTWLLSPNVDFSLAGGLFTMKAGQTAAADVLFSLYVGTDSSGPLLSSINLNNATFCAQTACGQYGFHQFILPTPISLVTGTTYFAALTSQAPDTQSQAYFIKSTYFVSDETGTPITPSPIGTTVSPIPEPASLLLFVTGLPLVWRRRRHARA